MVEFPRNEHLVFMTASRMLAASHTQKKCVCIVAVARCGKPDDYHELRCRIELRLATTDGNSTTRAFSDARAANWRSPLVNAKIQARAGTLLR